MSWIIHTPGRSIVIGLLVILLPLAATAHERRALGGNGGPGDERYGIDIGFRDEPVYVDQQNALWLLVTEVGEEGGPVVGLEASLNVEVEHGGQTIPLTLVPQSDPGLYEATFLPTETGDFAIRLFGTIEQLPIDETFSPDVIDSLWLEPPDATDSSQAPSNAPRSRRGARLIEEANARAVQSQRLAYIGIALGTLGLLVGLLALARSGRSRVPGSCGGRGAGTTFPRGAGTYSLADHRTGTTPFACSERTMGRRSTSRSPRRPQRLPQSSRLTITCFRSMPRPVLISLVLLLTGCSLASPPAAVTPTATSIPPTVTLIATQTPTPATPVAATMVATPQTALATATVAPETPPPAAALLPTLAPGAPSQVVEYGTSGRQEIALTFDAGADRGYAEEILDLLQAEGIPASFGIMGQWAEANPDLLQRMVDEGHMLFNHSWSHPSFTGATTQTAPLSTEERWTEVQRTEQVVRELTGYDLRPYFRPPYGDIDVSVLTDLAEMGYTRTLLWSCDSRDSLGATADEIMAHCIDTAQPGRIVLLHVGAQSAAYEALPRIIASLRARGFAFVTADQILRP